MGVEEIKVIAMDTLEKAKTQLNALTEKADFQAIKDKLNISAVTDKLNALKPDTSNIPFAVEKHCLNLAELGKPLGDGTPLCNSLKDMLKVAF
jgi:phage major head subunit gpT-like protein